MKALVKKESAPGLWLADLPIPEYGINDILIKIRKTGICGTDLHIYNWDAWSQQTINTPMTIGHEFVGVVEAVGSNVDAFKVGDPVSGEGHLVCGRCRNCLAGRRHLCPNTMGVGVNRDGAFAEYLVMPVTNVWGCHPQVPEEMYAIFDPLGNAVHTALSFDLLGEDVLITGAGPIALMAVAVAKHAGARFITVTDVNEYRLELARTLGATLAINVTKTTIAESRKTLGMTEGYDVGLEMSGNPSALRDMIANMCHGGKMALLGIQPENTVIDWNQVVFSSLVLKGIYGREMYETWYKSTVLIESGMDISPVITHRMHYEEFENGFEIMNSGKCGKVILDWD